MRGGQPVNGIGAPKGVRHMIARVKGKVYQVVGFEENEKGVGPRKRLIDVFTTTIKEIALRRAEHMLKHEGAKIVEVINPLGGTKWYKL